MPFKGESQPIAMPMVGYAYVPIQQADMRNISSAESALENGTVFPILNKPFGVYGKQINGDKIFNETSTDSVDTVNTANNAESANMQSKLNGGVSNG